MVAENWNDLIDRLRVHGVEFDSGLTDAEVVAAESRYRFRFPPDLRAFLQTALPCGGEFPDWRSGSEGGLRYWFDLPKRGIVFDIEHNGFWLDEWGPRPAALDEAVRATEQLVAAAPRLIPVYLHRMIPAEPHLHGNPVFSVHQTDIIVYGVDLRDYLTHEFLMSEDDKEEWRVPDGARPIRFWNLDRFQAVRWGASGICRFDNSGGTLP